MERNIKVRLTVDLTRYADGLTAGTEGMTVGRQGSWSKGNDRFVTVRFPEIATLDVLWESLEILDEEVIQEIKEEQQAYLETLKSAQDVILRVGPRGGFKSLSYTYIDKERGFPSHVSLGFAAKAEEAMKIFEACGIPVKREVIK